MLGWLEVSAKLRCDSETMTARHGDGLGLWQVVVRGRFVSCCQAETTRVMYVCT